LFNKKQEGGYKFMKKEKARFTKDFLHKLDLQLA